MRVLKQLVEAGFVVETWKDGESRSSLDRYVALVTVGQRGTPSWRGSGSSLEAALKEARGFWVEDNPGDTRLASKPGEAPVTGSVTGDTGGYHGVSTWEELSS